MEVPTAVVNEQLYIDQGGAPEDVAPEAAPEAAPSDVPLKTCGTCKNEKPIECFHKSKSRKDGVQFQCKTCDRDYKINRPKRHTEDCRTRTKVEANNIVSSLHKKGMNCPAIAKKYGMKDSAIRVISAGRFVDFSDRSALKLIRSYKGKTKPVNLSKPERPIVEDRSEASQGMDFNLIVAISSSDMTKQHKIDMLKLLISQY